MSDHAANGQALRLMSGRIFFFATNFIGGNFRHLSCVSGQCPLTLKREELRLKEKRSDTTEQCPLILKQEELKKCVQQGKAEVR